MMHFTKICANNKPEWYQLVEDILLAYDLKNIYHGQVILFLLWYLKSNEIFDNYPNFHACHEIHFPWSATGPTQATDQWHVMWPIWVQWNLSVTTTSKNKIYYFWFIM